MHEQPIGSFVEDEGGGEGFSYKATQWELRQLAKHWARRTLEVDWSYFVYRSSNPTSWRDKTVATYRIAKIAKIIGEQAVAEEIGCVRYRFGLLCDQRYWHVFNSGTREEWQQVDARISYEMEVWQDRMNECDKTLEGQGDTDSSDGVTG